MKLTLITGVTALALAASLSGCGTVAKQASQLAPLVDALARAGCSGTLHDSIGAQTAAGLSPGAAHVEHTFDGKCDPRDPPPVAASIVPPAQAAAASVGVTSGSFAGDPK